VVKEVVRTCTSSQLTRPYPPLDKTASWAPVEPWKRLLVDFGELDTRTFFDIFDAGTGYVIAHWTNGPKTSEAIRVLRTAFRVHGLCSTVVSDNGPAFAALDFDAFLRDRGIEPLKSAPFCPSSNGPGEMGVKLLKLHYRRPSPAKDGLVDAAANINLVPRSDGYSPTARLMGRQWGGPKKRKV